MLGLNKEGICQRNSQGKIAVVTGGSTGMGLATAKRFVEERMDHVFITGRRKDALDAAVAESRGPRAPIQLVQPRSCAGEFRGPAPQRPASSLAFSGDTGDPTAIWSWRLYRGIDSDLKALGAQIVVRTAELERYTQTLHNKLNLSFDILTELRLKVAEQFRLVFTLPDYLRELYKSFGNTLDRFHDEPEYRLPMPARYVIEKQRYHSCSRREWITRSDLNVLGPSDL